MTFQLTNGFIIVLDKLISFFGLVSKELFSVLAKVVNFKGDLVANDAEVVCVGALVDEEVEGGQELLELRVEPLPLADLHRGGGEPEEGEEGEEGGGEIHAWCFTMCLVSVPFKFTLHSQCMQACT